MSPTEPAGRDALTTPPGLPVSLSDQGRQSVHSKPLVQRAPYLADDAPVNGKGARHHRPLGCQVNRYHRPTQQPVSAQRARRYVLRQPVTTGDSAGSAVTSGNRRTGESSPCGESCRVYRFVATRRTPVGTRTGRWNPPHHPAQIIWLLMKPDWPGSRRHQLGPHSPWYHQPINSHRPGVRHSGQMNSRRTRYHSGYVVPIQRRREGSRWAGKSC